MTKLSKLCSRPREKCQIPYVVNGHRKRRNQIRLRRLILEPNPVLVTTVLGRLRGLSGQYVAGVGGQGRWGWAGWD